MFDLNLDTLSFECISNSVKSKIHLKNPLINKKKHEKEKEIIAKEVSSLKALFQLGTKIHPIKMDINSRLEHIENFALTNTLSPNLEKISQKVSYPTIEKDGEERDL
ncbi:uncharacterized protein LOC124432434 [Vespa crabro]|uniref:uncharacterized protein LOC124432434 n=1 Tax=Vespa crabro TaxID=7445 RepID=UPI001F00B8DA|nr:uncharacterized protein LOC124432434 [Vespa crabro]